MIPLVVYRVYVDGRPDELVRGVSIVGTPLAALSSIIATGDRQDIFNGECGAESGTIPVSAVAPAMLVSEIETQRQAQGTARPPIVPPPPIEEKQAEKTPAPRRRRAATDALHSRCLLRLLFSRLPLFAQQQHHAATSAKASADSDPLLNAMKEELTREQQLLVLPGMQRPYFIQYRLDDVHTYEAIANYGALTRERRESSACGARGGSGRRLHDGLELCARRWGG